MRVQIAPWFEDFVLHRLIPVVMFTIGFTTKFYTLWDVTVETFTNEYGRKGRRVTAAFIKNVSMDEQAARAKYPDAPVDLSLRGHSSFRRTDWEPMPGDVFPCGKYMGQPIAECTDWSYLYWAVDTNMMYGERRDIAVSVLLKSGRYAEYDGTILPMDRVNELLAEDAARDEIAAAIDLNGCVDLLNVTNIKAWDENEYGSETAVKRVNLIWDRATIERFEYNGWEYFLPVMAKKSSKATREQMYREIIEKEGRKWDDCKVLSFAFKYQMQTELFHYGLMAEKPDYFVFDCWEKYANVVVPKDEQNAAVIIAIAAKNGGEKTTPNLR